MIISANPILSMNEPDKLAKCHKVSHDALYVWIILCYYSGLTSAGTEQESEITAFGDMHNSAPP